MPHQRPERPSQQQPAQQQSAMQQPGAPQQQRKTVGPQQIGAIIVGMQEDIRALNSSILVISQKMQYLIRNEKILGRNLIVLSRKLKDLESGGVGGNGASEAGLNEAKSLIEESSMKITDYGQKILELQATIEEMKDRYAKREELKEIKYVIDSIHPLEFTTIKQVQELIEKKSKPKKK